MLRCGYSGLIQLTNDMAKIIGYRCKCWKCTECAPKLRNKLIVWAKKGAPKRFITLTVRRDEFPTPDLAAQALVVAWRRCREMLKRYHGHKDIEFLAVFEEHKSGWPHLHILTRSKFISQRWLSKYMGERINSPIVDIRKIKRAADAAAYVAKYIAKAPLRFDGCKRWWTSQNWAERAPKHPKDPAAVWIMVNDARAWMRAHFPDMATDYEPTREVVAIPIGPALGIFRRPEPP